MKAVMLSIQPKWCELIASGKKTIEVRKTVPQLETPFKCYIYCTKKNHAWYSDTPINGNPHGKIIGEFACNKIYGIKNYGSRFMVGYDIALTNRIAKESCLQFDDMKKYLRDKNGYGWHISDLKIYDKPKELGEFCKICSKKCDTCNFYDESYGACYGDVCLTRPPQSWCYVEELTE